MLPSKGYFIINGSYTFTAKSLRTNYESLQSEDSGRTDDGIMHINWVFRKVRKIEVEMPPMTSQELSKLMSLVQGQEYDITYFDLLDNAEKTVRVYTSTSKADLYNGIILDGIYQGVSFSGIELAGEN